MKEELMQAISHQFQDNHNYKNYIQFADDEFMSYNTQGNNLTRLLNMKQKPSDKMLIFVEKAFEMGQICEVNRLTGDMLVTSIILTQAKVSELEGEKQNRVKGTHANLQEATPR